MIAAALIAALAALALAFVAWQRAMALAHDLAQTRQELGVVRNDLVQTRTALQTRLDELCRESLRQAGQLKFLPAMTIAEAMAVHPGVTQVLADFQLGGCSNCAVSDVDTLEGACRSYGIDQDALMAALARLVAAPAGTDASSHVKPIDVARMRVQI